MLYEPGFSSQEEEDETVYWLLFKRSKLLILEKNGQISLPDINLTSLGMNPVRKLYIGRVGGRSCYADELSPDTAAPKGMLFCHLMRLLDQIPDDMFVLAGKAYHIMNWDRSHRFCSRCGTPTENKRDERAKLCPACGFVNYPRISPAIIVAVTRGRELLLAKGNHSHIDFYSVLAGFVEQGETFEECVQREVEEEVGLKVKNIKYFGSQPWPFPDSLMVGFTAEYESGEITIDKREILSAGWFTADQLPPIPSKGSIAGQLIDWFIQNNE